MDEPVYRCLDLRFGPVALGVGLPAALVEFLAEGRSHARHVFMFGSVDRGENLVQVFEVLLVGDLVGLALLLVEEADKVGLPAAGVLVVAFGVSADLQRTAGPSPGADGTRGGNSAAFGS